MNSRFEGDARKVCLLTGAGGLLGSAFCRTFARRYRIAAVYRNHPPATPSQNRRLVDPLHPYKQVPGNRSPIFEIKADLASQSDVDRAVDIALARFGRIDLIVNAVGIALDAPFLDNQRFERALQEQMITNVLIPMRVATSALFKFWRNRYSQNTERNRNIVNVSSTSGLFVYRRPQRGAYGASKAALNFLSCHLANEFRQFGVRVNVLAPTTFPGLIPTESVVRAIARLDTDSVTGRVLMLNRGGQRLMSSEYLYDHIL